MQLSQSPKTVATFDETNLISSAGLVPVMRLARRAGLGARVSTKLTVPGGAGSDAAAKVCSIVAGMLTGADSIADLGVLREGAVQSAPRGEGAVHIGHLPAGLHLRSRPATRCRRGRVPHRAGRAGAVADRA